MHCFFGSGLQTPLKYHYPNSSSTSASITYGDGDGSVNIESSRICQEWMETATANDSKVCITCHLIFRKNTEFAEFFSERGRNTNGTKSLNAALSQD